MAAIATKLLPLGGMLMMFDPVWADDCTWAHERHRAAVNLYGKDRVTEYERIAAICPDFTILYSLGRAFQGIGDNHRALASFKKALSLENVGARHRAFAKVRQVQSLLALDRLAEALALMEEAEQAVGDDIPSPFRAIRRQIDEHPRRNRLTAEELGQVFGLLDKSYLVAPRLDLRFYFVTESADLTAAGQKQVTELAHALSNLAGGYKVELIGHTDVRGGRDYNQLLSERRAIAVRQRLISKAPDLIDRIEAKGVGEDQPLYPGETDDDHRLNRRVEVRLHPRTDAGTTLK